MNANKRELRSKTISHEFTRMTRIKIKTIKIKTRTEKDSILGFV